MANKGKTPINAGRPVYFSYARNNDAKPEWRHIADCVDQLIVKFKQHNIEYRVDVNDLIIGDRISGFEKEIGQKSDSVVIVFSDRYFRSMHCMHEFSQIKRSLKKNPNKRLLCIKSGNFNLADVEYLKELERFWAAKKNEYEHIDFHRLRKPSSAEKAAFDNGFYLDDIMELYSFFSGITYIDLSRDGLDGFVNDIIKYYTSSPTSKSSNISTNNSIKSKKNNNNDTIAPIATKKKSRVLFWIFFNLFVLFLIGGVVYYFYNKCPFDITVCTLVNHDRFDHNLPLDTKHANNVYPIIDYTNSKPGPYEIFIKVFDFNGKLLTEPNSPEGYSYKKVFSLENSGTEVLDGFGEDGKFTWYPGDYRFEFYYRGRFIYYQSFNLPEHAVPFDVNDIFVDSFALTFDTHCYQSGFYKITTKLFCPNNTEKDFTDNYSMQIGDNKFVVNINEDKSLSNGRYRIAVYYDDMLVYRKILNID